VVEEPGDVPEVTGIHAGEAALHLHLHHVVRVILLVAERRGVVPPLARLGRAEVLQNQGVKHKLMRRLAQYEKSGRGLAAIL
jgi:hypothetical protein